MTCFQCKKPFDSYLKLRLGCGHYFCDICICNYTLEQLKKDNQPVCPICKKSFPYNLIFRKSDGKLTSAVACGMMIKDIEIRIRKKRPDLIIDESKNKDQYVYFDDSPLIKKNPK